MDFDDVLIATGQFGRFQKQLLYSMSILQILMGISNFSFVFLGARNQFACVLENKTVLNDTCCNECTEYVPQTEYRSYALDWGIICNQVILSNIQVSHMAGLFIGAIFIGNVADRFGRLPVLYVSMIFMSFFNFITIFVHGPYFYMVVTCMSGIACQGAGLMSYNIILEFVGPKYRAFCGIFEQIIYAFGIALLALLAYLIPNWVNLAIAISVFGPPALLLMLPFYIESIRWQASQPNSRHKVLKGLKYMIETNGQDMEQHMQLIESWLSQKRANLEIQPDTANEENSLLQSNSASTVSENLLDLFKYRDTLKWLIVLCISWFMNAACYYGSTIEAGEAFSNPFLGFALSGLIEIPAHCCSPFLMNKFGRRYFHSILMMMSGVFFLLVWPLSMLNEVIIYIVFTLAKLCCSMAFASAYVYASELFPTSVASAAIGFCLTIGRFGAVISPYVLPLGRSQSSLIFGIAILIGGAQALLLKETLNKSVPLTMRYLRQQKDAHNLE